MSLESVRAFFAEKAPDISVIESRLSIGALRRMYLFCRAAFTLRIRNRSFSKTVLSSGDRSGLETRTASEHITVSTSRSPFENSVLPELTRSQTASARPIDGAISTEPLIACISALTPFASNASFAHLKPSMPAVIDPPETLEMRVSFGR